MRYNGKFSFKADSTSLKTMYASTQTSLAGSQMQVSCTTHSLWQILINTPLFPQLSIPISEVTTLEKKMTAYVIPNAIQVTTPRAKYTFASLLARDTTFDVIFNIWRLARPDDSAAGSTRVSLDDGGRMAMDEIRVAAPNGTADPSILRKATQCACGCAGTHFSETALETVLPGTPDRIHNLIFASGFMKDFMKDDQKLLGAYNYTPLSVSVRG